MFQKIKAWLKKVKKWIIGILIGGATIATVTTIDTGPPFTPFLPVSDVTVFKIATWGCNDSAYQQDFEPTAVKMRKHFGEGSPAYVCPDGFGGQMFKVTDPAKKMQWIVAGPSQIENEIITQDNNRENAGKPLLTGEEKSAYRTKRLDDIQKALDRAKLFEEK